MTTTNPPPPKRRPYNASGSLSEYGVFPECDAQQAAADCTCPHQDAREPYHDVACPARRAQQLASEAERAFLAKDFYEEAREGKKPWPAQQPAADQFIATFRCEDNGIVGTTDAKIHSVTCHDNGRIEVVIDHWPEQPAGDAETEALAKYQPCGCVICTCEDEKQCQGCGAKHCGNRTNHPAYVKQQPTAHPAITHCDNCGLDWLDNGLNPVGCPYCKQRELLTLAEQWERDAGGCRRDGYMDAAVVKENCAFRLRQALGISAIAKALATKQPAVVDGEAAEALRFLLTRIGSWTNARWDQHLRHEFGDDRAARMIATLAAQQQEPTT